MYHIPVHPLAERALVHIRRLQLLRPGDRLGIAVSGGIDSVALMRLMIELRPEIGIVLSLVHFNHKLRGAESDADQEFVASLAREYGLEFQCESGDVAAVAGRAHSGLEAASRELRHSFFGRLLGVPCPANILDKVATGHTLDDQAETVVMRMIRGTGMRGLGGIYPRIIVEPEDEEGQGEIIRPLLGIRRRELEKYLVDIKQTWREDASNADSKFTRNRVRKMILPLLEQEFNPSVVENFSELAEIARDEEDYWDNEISGWLGTVVQWSEPSWDREEQNVNLVQIDPVGSRVRVDSDLASRIKEAPWLVMNATVSRPWLLTEPKAVQRRVLKAIGEQAGIQLEFKHVEEALRFAEEDGPAGKELSLPLGWKLVRQAEAIVFVTPDLRWHAPIPDYEYSLPVPGSASVPELGIVIEALRISLESRAAEYNPQQLLRADLLPAQLTVRNWRSGDRYWPSHTKAPKKIKELLQERYVGGSLAEPGRGLWPVAVAQAEIVWMRGFPVPRRLLARPGDVAVLIREIPLDERNAI